MGQQMSLSIPSVINVLPTVIKFNPHTGKIDEVVLYKDAEKVGKIRGWIYSVHVGSWGGMLTRLLTFIAALIGATLPLTGYYLWIKRIWRKKVRVS